MNDELKKLAPKIYEDALQGATKEVGKVLQEAVRVSLRPVSGLISTVDNTYSWIEQKLAEKFLLEEKPPEELITPNPEMAIRVVQGLQTSIAIDDPLPRSMFINLLAGSMDKEESENTHPAFAETLKNMTAEDCRIFSVVASTPSTIQEASASAFQSNNKPKEKGLYFSKDVYPLQEQTGISSTSRLSLHIANLIRLGLIETNRKNILPGEDFGSKYEAEIMKGLWDEFEEFKRENANKPSCPEKIKFSHFRSVRLISWGHEFSSATGANWSYSQGSNKFIIPEWAG